MNSAARLAAVCAAAVACAVVVRTQQKPCPTASKFGPDGQAGNVNHIAPAKTLAASRLATTGKAYRLGVETNKGTPRRTFNPASTAQAPCPSGLQTPLTGKEPHTIWQSLPSSPTSST